jgi:hypothetical protein
MPIVARHLALAACLTLLGSAADAEANRRGRPRKIAKAKYDAPLVDRDKDDEDDDDEDAVDVDDDDDAEDADDNDDDEADERDRRKRKQRARRKAVAAEGDSAEIDAPAKLRKRGVKAGLRDWNFAIGPNVWMVSVDANVAVGDKSLGTAIDFFQLSRHTRYGIPVLAEARYKRFTFAADLLYGVVDVAGANEVGPVMVTLDATVSSLLVDGLAGFRFLGDDESRISLEARAGIRYQRTAIAGSVDLGGSGFSPKTIVDAGGDFLAGGRVVVRPFRRFYLSGTVDQSLAGSSTSTWSAGAELNVRIVSRVLLAVGWRTLTQQRAAISTVMHGPRAAVQLLF